jgi:hypothetical protein
MSTFEFYGETFTLNSDVSEFALLEFAEAASDGQDGDTMQGLASLMRLVKECIAESDRRRFMAAARKNRAGAEALTKVIEAALGERTERPTGQPADSSGGQASIQPKSGSSSVDKAAVLFPGRPDMRKALRSVS